MFIEVFTLSVKQFEITYLRKVLLKATSNHEINEADVLKKAK